MNGNIFYKIQFEITLDNKKDDLLRLLICHLKNWLCRKWNRRGEQTYLTTDNPAWTKLKYGGTIYSMDGRSIYIRAESCPNDSVPEIPFWACYVSEKRAPKSYDFAPREWITEIGVEPKENGKADFSCVISYVDQPGFIGRCEDEPTPNIPNIIKNILNDSKFSCTCGIDTVNIEAHQLLVGEWLPFWERVKNPGRTVPYIFISPEFNGSDKTTLLVDPYQVAIASGGNAIVYYSKDKGLIDEMNYICGKEYRCYGGAIRIYFPGLSEDDPRDSYRHRYLSKSLIALIGQDGIVRMLRRALAQDVHFYERLFRIDDCKEKAEELQRKQRLDELKRRHKEETDEITKEHQEKADAYFDLATDEEEKRLRAESELSRLKIENRTIREENYNLSTEIESYRPLAARNAELEKVCESRLAIKAYPQVHEDVIAYFEATFEDRLAFSDEAKKSVKGCMIPVEELWKVFFALATAMCELYKVGTGDIYKDFKSKTGIDISRGEGTMTRKDNKLMRQFEINYHGEDIDIEPHITYPKLKQSIHFGFSSKDQKIVVGWCGEHKKNYTTRKVH